MSKEIEAAPGSFSLDAEVSVYLEGLEFEADVYVDNGGEVIHLGIETGRSLDDVVSVGADLTPEEAMAVAERLSMLAAEKLDFTEAAP